MAFDLVSAYSTTPDAPFYVAGGTAQTLREAPQQITLRFSPGVKIDSATLGSISIVRSGGANDAFSNGNDVTIVPGSISVNDLPNQNEAIVRFADTLPDDSYRITIGAGLKTTAGDTMTASRTFDVRLDLGAFVVSVVPQPVSRTGGVLTQNRDQIVVYFNANDPLKANSATTADSYRLFEIDNATGNPITDSSGVAIYAKPTTVSYDASSGKALLTFDTGVIADNKLYRLQVGSAEALIKPADPANPVNETAADHSSFAKSQDLGQLSSAGAIVSGSISVQPTVTTPAGNLGFPSQPGSLDEPGHRNVPTEIGNNNGLTNQTVGSAHAIPVYFYNFQDVYGQDPQGNDLHNAITETQKQRAREIFDLISRYEGVRFVETASSGITVATGDVRAISSTTPPDAVGGMGGGAGGVGKAIMSSLQDWGASEYGGAWFQVAMHEIGHALELAHSWELPSIMGAGLTGEPVFPGDYDKIQLAQHYPSTGSDVDVYKFTLSAAGTLSAETIVARPGQVAASKLDGLLTLYREDSSTGRRELVARNDDYYGRDSFLGLDLTAGTYYIAVSSTGNEAFNPEIADSGYGGRSDGDYQLKLGFQPASTSLTTIVDVSDTQLDGDRDGKAGGAFNFWFNTASTLKTVFVDKSAIATGADGTAAKPYATITAALDAVNTANTATPGSKTLIRIVGNTAGAGGTALPYLVGTDLAGRALSDGATFNVPAGVTVMIDEGAVFKLRAANIDVGSSSALVLRTGASLQVLGTPTNKVTFTSYHDDSIGGNSDGFGPAATGGHWGGIVFRADSDSATKKAFVDSISQAVVTYGGGQVYVDSQLDSFAPIQLENTRPTLAFNTITNSAGAGISATPDSFEDSNGRIGPEIRGNTLLGNSTNGLFVKIRTPLGGEPERLDVPARFRSTDIVYVLQDNLFIAGGAGGYERKVDPADGNLKDFARKSGRLTIDPGVVVKLQGARIELERGTSQLIAEGTAGQRVIFTSLGDNRFGAGGTFDTNGNLPDVRTAGDWGGIVLDAGSKASIDYAYIAYGGGQTPIEGTLDNFNVIETHQGDLRLAHSRIENNAAGKASTNRTGRGGNAAATVFVRGAQPVILGNDFRDNVGAVVSVNANALSDVERPDPGRSTGAIARDARYDDNRGPLVRDNRLSYTISASAGRPAGGAIEGMMVRGEEITTETVWDDTDIVHVLQSEIVVNNFQTAIGIRLVSQPAASLVVKLAGTGAGLTAAGYGTDISDRIGGTVQVVGQPGYPVVLTSLKDDSVGASLDPLGQLQKDTNADGSASTPSAGDWRSLKFLPFSNDTNVAIVQESEQAAAGWAESNSTPATAQVLGVLAPNSKSGDDNRRLGFEVHGAISWTSPADVDVYSFTGYAGSEVWLDIDKTSSGLDTMVELLDASGTVRARSADSQTDIALAAAPTNIRGIGSDLEKDSWQGGDFYSVNPKDPGMRVILPGTPGDQNQYFIRVRSQPRYASDTTPLSYKSDLADAAKVTAGATSGAYELRVRLQQRDQKPGSTVRYADIRYPQVGIDVMGLPQRSLLTGETGESTATNDLFANAQFVGNVLQSDQATISIAGAISSVTDVDWYTFALNYEQLENITGVNAGGKSWSTVFDIDYGDGFRGDLTLSVFDSTGKLIYVGRDSNVASDQGGSTFTDTSTGSAGKLDPFIGSVQLPAGAPTGSGGLEAGGGVVAADPTKQLKYYVAVSSNERLPAALDATFKSSATNSLIRLEPVNSVTRVVEDHIGYTGYTSGTTIITPTTGSLIDPTNTIALSTHVTPFTLSDVTLFVSAAKTLVTVDAMRGGVETVVSTSNGADDIVMRSDGRLYGYRGLLNTQNTAGTLDLIDSGTGARTPVGNDNIPQPAGGIGDVTNIPAREAGAVGATTYAISPPGIGVTVSTVSGTVQYTGTVSGTPATGTWQFSANSLGQITSFTSVSVPVGLPAPTGGSVNGATGILTIVWNSLVVAPSAPLLVVSRELSNPQAVNTDSVDAIAWKRTGEGEYKTLFYSVRDGARSRLYRADPATGSAAIVDGEPWGRVNAVNDAYIQDVGNSLGNVTGMAFVGNTLYGVDTKGFLFSIDLVTARATLIDLDQNSPGNNPIPGGGTTVTFAGLTIGPQNLSGGALKNALFAIDTNGVLYAFSTSGVQLTVFDANKDGVAEAKSIQTGAAGATGLAFSPLDINLWHPTTTRGTDLGHGVNVAPDGSRSGATQQSVVDGKGNSRSFAESAGGVSMAFNLEQYVGSGTTPYLNYQSGSGQYGVLDSVWQQDLSSNTAIPNTYNLPGGAYGSLTTNAFDLSAYSSYTDKPTLYFNYWLQTQGASGKIDSMRDSARAFVSIDGGTTWELIATNNSSLSTADTADAELPAFPSASAKISTNANQQVQQLYNSGTWRQARIDLGNYAGKADIRLRFDFSTAGEFDSTQNWANNTRVTAAVANSPDVVVADITGVVPGMEVWTAGVATGQTVVSVDAATNTVTLDGDVTLNNGDAIAFVLPHSLNGLNGLAGTTGDFKSPGRGQNNQYEGFYVDDIIVGFAERGEMVTGANAGQTGFYSVGTPLGGTPSVPAQALTGPYQLEIRHGTTYAEMTDSLKGTIALNNTFDTNENLVASNTTLGAVDSHFNSIVPFGDANTARQQGQFLIQNNIIAAAATYGISIDAGVRDTFSNDPIPGTPRNLPVLNNSRLVPGVVVANNVVSTSGTAGILFSGDPNTGTVPNAAVPYGRIVNNTIYGGATPKGTGVVVSENAGPTLMNNLFANLATGVSVDATSRFDSAGNQRTVITTSAFYAVGTQVAGGATQSQALSLTSDPFVNASTGNFYLRSGTPAIDSSLNSLADRNEFVVVNVPLGVPQSPVIAPNFDLFGQLRGDDPSQASQSGLGTNVYKDRGAIDRVDFNQPFATILTPVGQGVQSPNDLDPSADGVTLRKEDARGITKFELQLADNGVGIDKATVLATGFTLSRDGVLLTAGVDYSFIYLESANRVVFSAASVFQSGAYVIEARTPQSAGMGGITADLAGNTLLSNQTNGTLLFTVVLQDVPTTPTGLVATSGDKQITLSWTPSTSAGSPLLPYEIQSAQNNAFTGAATTNAAATMVSSIVTGLTNGTQYWFRIRAVNGAGASEWSNVAGPVVPLATPTLSLGSGIANGATAAEATQSSGVVTVTGENGAAIVVTFTRGANTVTKNLTGTGTAQAVVLTNADLSTLGNGGITVSATQAIGGSISAQSTVTFTLDTVAPNAPVLALGTGVSNGASAAEATQTSGVVTVTGENNAAIVVTFTRGANTVTKNLTGTGLTQAVVLTNADLSTLGNGLVSVSATQADAAGNLQTAPPAATSFMLDTVAPNAPILTLGTGVSNGATYAEATQASGVVTVTGENGAAIVVTFTRGANTVTKSLTGNGTTQAIVLTNADLSTLGNGLVSVSATQADAAGNLQTAPPAATSFMLDTVAPNAPTLALGVGVSNGATAAEATQASGIVTVTGELGAAIVVTLRRGGGTPVIKNLTGTGVAQAVVLTGPDLTTLGNGIISVTAIQTDAAGNAQTAPPAATSFTLDSVAPNAPTLTLGTGVSDGASASEAIQASGVVTVSGENGAAIVVTLRRGGGTPVIKNLTGTGAAQAVILTGPDLTTLGDGLISVSATQTDAAGNTQIAPPATTSFLLDTLFPSVWSVTSSVPNGTYFAGQVVAIQMAFSEPVVVTGTPTLALNTSPQQRAATYATGSGSNTLTFNYTISLGDSSVDLNYASTSALAGGTIRDQAGNDAIRTLPLPATSSSLGGSKNIVIDGALRAWATGFGTTAANAPSFTTAVRTIPLTFNGPVTGLSLSQMRLYYNDRLISLSNATLTGSGTTFTLSLPSTTTALRGAYRLELGGPTSTIVSGGIRMTQVSSIFWKRV